LKNDPLNGAELVRAILKKDPEAYVIVYSGDPSQAAATASWGAGAVGFVQKGPGDQLLQRIQEQCTKFDETRSTLSPRQLKSSNSGIIEQIGMVGRSNNLAEVAENVLKFKNSPETVIIYGETGVGKELIARALHHDPKKPFCVVNGAAFKQADLLESELFGAERGAYTGANESRAGIFELAQGGTVFFDEIHQLSLAAQAKLLRAFAEKKVRRVGGKAEYPVNFRLIVAAKPELIDMQKNGEFLSDLFYRVAKLPIHLSALRDRREDIAPLIYHFAEKYRKEQGLKGIFRNSTVRKLELYDWPGNVREVDNVVCGLMSNCTGTYIETTALDPRLYKGTDTTQMTWETFQKRQFDERRGFILKVCEGSVNKAHAARRLGIQPHAIHAILKNYDIDWSKKPSVSQAERVVLK